MTLQSKQSLDVAYVGLGSEAILKRANEFPYFTTSNFKLFDTSQKRLLAIHNHATAHERERDCVGNKQGPHVDRQACARDSGFWHHQCMGIPGLM